mmetsp:Transcript_20555/g.64236  ORF Transcript_20555/g.64236 Transcript_20555/m.64236 type:complete len:221 (-) Transcript_20555:323-985(-)
MGKSKVSSRLSVRLVRTVSVSLVGVWAAPWMRSVPCVPLKTASSGVLVCKVTSTEAVSPGSAGAAKPASAAETDQSTRASPLPTVEPVATTFEGAAPPLARSMCPSGYMAMSMLTPPLAGCRSRECGPLGSSVAGQPKSAATVLTLPMAPLASNSRAFRSAGKQRVHIPSARRRPFSRAFVWMRRAPVRVRAMGFSTSTCFPAFSAARQRPSCESDGLPM